MAETTNKPKDINYYINLLDDLKKNLSVTSNKDDYKPEGTTTPIVYAKDDPKKNDPSAKNYNEIPNPTKKNYIRWYPHREVSNRPDLTHNPIPLAPHILETYGAYHFEIFFYPEFKFFAFDQLLDKKHTENIQAQRKENTENIYKVSNESYGSKLLTQVTNAVSTGVQTGISVGKQAWEDVGDTVTILTGELNKELVIPTPMNHFNGESNLKCDIYLPLNSYKTNKQSGIQSQEDQQSNIGVSFLKNNAVDILDKHGVARQHFNSVSSRLGASVRDFVAPRVTKGNLDNLQLSWEFVPRNPLELNHIIDIIRFFNSSSVPLFHPGELIYRNPPFLTMEIITHNHTKKEKQTIRPKKQYYITEVNINANGSGSDDGLILTPDGYPMNLSLEVKLIKADLTTFSELFEFPLM